MLFQGFWPDRAVPLSPGLGSPIIYPASPHATKHPEKRQCQGYGLPKTSLFRQFWAFPPMSPTVQPSGDRV